MTYALQSRINADINLKKFLRENSYWYKVLNRNENAFNEFVSDMKVKYKLTTGDKINKTIDNISMIQSFLEVLK
ncbi:MAG: YlbE-like family protein [Bacilli bacterium]|nr:YlbE-like family protein [Bacilli bacterium]